MSSHNSLYQLGSSIGSKLALGNSSNAWLARHWPVISMQGWVFGMCIYVPAVLRGTMYLILVFFHLSGWQFKTTKWNISKPLFQIALTHSWGNSHSLGSLFSVFVVWSPFPFHQPCRQAWWGTAIMHILSQWIVRVKHTHADKFLFYGYIILRFLPTKVVDAAVEVVTVMYLVVRVKNCFLFYPHFMSTPQSTICQKCSENFLGPLKPRFLLN